MFLLYINELGVDYKGQRQYEFIFGESVDILDLVDEWFTVPSSGRAGPPELEQISLVGILKNSDLELSLVQNSDYFGMVDAVDGIIALGWETFNVDYEERPLRLSFHFGEEFNTVIKKLKFSGLELIIEEIKTRE